MYAGIGWERVAAGVGADRIRLEIIGVDPGGSLFAELPPLTDGGRASPTVPLQRSYGHLIIHFGLI